ncbi:hypoxia up-regulated protein 1-like [Panonychus citri]|uniref:hypoxia up-regulated protein 1-like n=1 Tax=Panonychus citri TaxID=50023 RepID=UPI002307BAE2|nr:hypoxia up-regulated protein 1-like [Panonychus citri]
MRLICVWSLLVLMTSLFCQGYGLTVMSVDVGTESLKISIVSAGKPMEIILNTDSQRKTPLAVGFRDGERLFGEAAMTTAVRFPDKVFTYFLDLIGKNYDSPAVKLFRNRFKYHNITKDDEKSTIIWNHPEGMAFTPEELLAMIIGKAKSDAEIASGDKQYIQDAVITVPPYFSQAERRSLIRSVQLAGLKVLQLINTNTAVALNYGAFRRKDFNESANHILFYEMGASSTIASVVAYQTVKTKEAGFVESNPQLTIKGIGFDRNLGGLEMQIRLRDHLAKLFTQQINNKYDVYSNKRSMAKLFREAGRLKKVLSANSEHMAQVENVLNDIDLKVPVKRSDFEDLCADLLNDRLTKPVIVALESAGLTIDNIDQIILFGGNTRVPKVQQALLDYFKITDLGKSVNADEAAALGGAYQAAHLSKGFKVKTFIIKDSNLYPIQVDFAREIVVDDGSKKTKIMQRTLFTKGNLYPTKKVLVFSRHADDFEFYINYGDLSFLSREDIGNIGAVNITKISVKGVDEAIEKHKNETKEYKGIRAHFRMDESGVLNLETVEAVFEREIEEIVEPKEEENVVGDAFAKFGNTISKLFGGSEESAPTSSETKSDEQSTGETSSDKISDTPNATDSSSNDTESTEQKEIKNGTEEASPPKTEIKIKTIKEPVTVERIELDLQGPNDDEVNESMKKLQKLSAKDEEKQKRDGLKNNLESFILETRIRLTENEAASTPEQREKMLKALDKTSEWLEYESDGADSKAIEGKFFELLKAAQDVFEIVKEPEEEPTTTTTTTTTTTPPPSTTSTTTPTPATTTTKIPNEEL